MLKPYADDLLDMIINGEKKKRLLVKSFIYGEFGNSEIKMAYYTDISKYSNIVYWGKKIKMKTMI